MSTRLQISVEGGTSDRTSIELVPGTPVEPFSVGSQASWVVSGAGVMPTHAYLYFDGTTLYVAAAPGTQVRAADADVSADWKPLTPPCAIELGAVRLSVRAPGAAAQQPAAQPGAAAPTTKAREFEDATYDDDAPTQYQPVPPEFLDRARDLETTVRQPNGPEPALGATLPHPVRVEPPPQSERTRVLAQPNQPEPRMERPAPPSVPPASDGATVVQPLEDFLAQHKPNEPDTARREIGAPLPAAGRPPEPAYGAGYGAGAPAAPWTPGAYGAGPAVMGGPMGAPPMPGSPMAGPPMPGAYGAESPYGGQPGYPPQPGGFGMPGMPAPGMPTPGMATPAQQYGQVMPGPGQQQPGGGSAKKDPLADVKRAWAAASLPRRIMWVLGPFILIGAFYTALKPKAKPRRPSSKPVASASASPSGSTAVAPKPTASATPKPSVAPPPDQPTAAGKPSEPATEPVSRGQEPPAEEAADAAAPEPPPKGTLTKQRQAVDAVALGDYEKAVTLYEELAAEHPKNQDYKTAIEVLKKKAGSAKKKK